MTREEMERLTEGVTVIAEKVRMLHDVGATRSEIAAFLGIRYQHVHNVLKRGNRLGTAPAEPVTPASRSDAVHALVVEPGGRVTLPPAFLAAQGIADGDVLICREGEGGGGLQIVSREAAVAELREIALQRLPGEAALLDALLGQSPKPG